MGILIDNDKMPDENEPETDNHFVDAIEKLQSPALEIMKKNGLNFEQMAQSAAIATAFIIQQSKNITPEEGFSTAIYYYIDGSKTYPPEFPNEPKKATNLNIPVKDNTSSKDHSKPWWKFW